MNMPDHERLAEKSMMHIDALALDFITYKPPYDHLAEQAGMAVANGNENAYSIPAIGFIVDATIGEYRMPEFSDFLPSEIKDRSNLAQDQANLVASYAFGTNVFRDYYLRSPHLRPHFHGDNLMGILDVNYLQSHGSAPFREASIVAGGALRFLRSRQEFAEPPADIIARSTGLLAIASIPKPHQNEQRRREEEMRQRHRYFGFPYVKEGHLTARGDPPEVTFNARVRQYIKQLIKASPEKPSGCPARSARSAEDPGVTVLQQYWEKLVRFLIPSDATVDCPDQTHLTTPSSQPVDQ